MTLAPASVTAMAVPTVAKRPRQEVWRTCSSKLVPAGPPFFTQDTWPSICWSYFRPSMVVMCTSPHPPPGGDGSSGVVSTEGAADGAGTGVAEGEAEGSGSQWSPSSHATNLVGSGAEDFIVSNGAGAAERGAEVVATPKAAALASSALTAALGAADATIPVFDAVQRVAHVGIHLR
eukprot:scaffold1224_cov191-Pinguiococcus_pyrenoidosus.AAC.8